MIAINSYLFKTEVRNVPYSEFKELISKVKISDIIIDMETVQERLPLMMEEKLNFSRAGWRILIL